MVQAENNESVKENYFQSFLENGFVTIDSYFSQGFLDKINSEFDQIKEQELSHNEKSNNSFQSCFYPYDLEGNCLIEQYSGLLEFINDSLLIELVKRYFKSFNYVFSKDTISTRFDLELNKEVGKSNNSFWHFDRVPSVKIALFLNEVGENEGVTEILPGSHIFTRNIMREQLEKNPNPLELNNYFEGLELGSHVPSHHKAGTIVLFDTMAIHKGGEILEQGSYRKTLRYVFQVKEINSNYLTTTNDPRVIPTYQKLHHPFTHESDRSKVNPNLLYKNS